MAPRGEKALTLPRLSVESARSFAPGRIRLDRGFYVKWGDFLYSPPRCLGVPARPNVLSEIMTFGPGAADRRRDLLNERNPRPQESPAAIGEARHE